MSASRGNCLAGLSCALLLILSLSAPALAGDVARLPRPRPPVEAKPDSPSWAEELGSRFKTAKSELGDAAPAVEQAIPGQARGAIAAITRIARLPHPRPQHPTSLLAMLPPRAAHVEAPDAEPEDTACLARLHALGVVFAKEDPIEPDGLCSVPHPLHVTSLGAGVAIEPKAILNCRTAEALALWTQRVLIPAARDLLDARPVKIVHDSTYVCRTRNNQPGAKLSEHAHADAVDIRSIAFATREPFHVENRDMSSTEGRFQVAIRGGSCGYFTTVLGPRSNAAHATHFHFDMAQRRHGYRLCDLADTNFVGGKAPRNAKRE